MSRNTLKKIFIALCIPLLFAQSCSKAEDSRPQTETLSDSEKAEIAELKILLSEITSFPVDKIVYNEKEQAFYYMGVKQITKERLILIKAAR
jgi:hypothetical protein